MLQALPERRCGRDKRIMGGIHEAVQSGFAEFPGRRRPYSRVEQQLGAIGLGADVDDRADDQHRQKQGRECRDPALSLPARMEKDDRRGQHGQDPGGAGETDHQGRRGDRQGSQVKNRTPARRSGRGDEADQYRDQDHAGGGAEDIGTGQRTAQRDDSLLDPHHPKVDAGEEQEITGQGKGQHSSSKMGEKIPCRAGFHVVVQEMAKGDEPRHVGEIDQRLPQRSHRKWRVQPGAQKHKGEHGDEQQRQRAEPRPFPFPEPLDKEMQEQGQAGHLLRPQGPPLGQPVDPRDENAGQDQEHGPGEAVIGASAPQDRQSGQRQKNCLQQHFISLICNQNKAINPVSQGSEKPITCRLWLAGVCRFTQTSGKFAVAAYGAGESPGNEFFAKNRSQRQAKTFNGCAGGAPQVRSGFLLDGSGRLPGKRKRITLAASFKIPWSFGPGRNRWRNGIPVTRR